MKHTKKMILVPEDEYMTLMNLFGSTGVNNLKLEKAQTEAKMTKIFDNPQLSQLEKGVRINMLDKKRRQLKKLIENRPLKIILETKNKEKPTTGIFPLEVDETNLQEMQNIPEIEIEENEETMELPINDNETQIAKNNIDDEEIREIPVKNLTQNDALSKIRGILKPEYYNELKKYVYDNRQILGVTNVGGIINNMKTQSLIKDSNLQDVLKHFTGEKEASKGTAIAISISRLYNRLKKDEKFQELLSKSKQRGMGMGKNRKNYIIQLNTKNKDLKVKTPGLPRFKPKLWAKLPV